jgi:UDP-2,3-diacylglucosamine pyrophosphatase LpxH
VESVQKIEDFFPLAKVSEDQLCEALAHRNLVWDDPEVRLRRKLLVSDMHLGPGEGSPIYSAIEDFTFDAPWTEFLATQATHAPTDLIIVGDFIEFWQIEAALGQPPGSTQSGAVAALEVAIAAHPDVFSAMSSFLSAGDHRVIFVPGNHDAELLWPAVQLRIAQEIQPTDMSRLVFVNSIAYRHGDVHVEHGHRLDGQNSSDTPWAPVRMDETGVCRLEKVWGEVFLAEFFNSVEQQYPFVDNLSPERAALIWGVKDEPDTIKLAGIAGQFFQLLAAEEHRSLNLSALQAMLLRTAGVPHKAEDDASLRAKLWQALPANDEVTFMLSELLTNPEYAGLRKDFLAVAKAMPSPTRTGIAFAGLDWSQLASLIKSGITNPATVAAEAIPHASIVVLGHTHRVGGSIDELKAGRYLANTGAWVATESVAVLKQRGLGWDQLDSKNSHQFPARRPAVLIDYVGGKPVPPRLIYAAAP